MKKINLGCGSKFHPDWTNIDFVSSHPDVIAHNLNSGIPFENESFDVAYSSHVLEHFTKSNAVYFLKECFRVLKKGGIIRIVVPDLEMICRLYLENLDKAARGDKSSADRYQWMKIELLDQIARNESGGEMLKYWKQNPMPAEDFVIERMGAEAKGFIEYFKKNPDMPNPSEPEKTETGFIRNIKNYIIKKMIKGSSQFFEMNSELQKTIDIGKFRLSGEIHQWMYDRYSLSLLLSEAGFREIRVLKAAESGIPDFQKYALDTDPDGKTRKPDSLFIEAVK